MSSAGLGLRGMTEEEIVEAMVRDGIPFERARLMAAILPNRDRPMPPLSKADRAWARKVAERFDRFGVRQASS